MRTIAIVLLFAISAAALSEEVDYYVDNANGTDSPEFGGVQDSSWKTISYAFGRLWSYVNNDSLDFADTVILYLSNGPFHLGEDNDDLSPMSWWGANKPHLIIDGGVGRTIITGIDPNDALSGWQDFEPDTTRYSTNWPGLDQDYDFDWASWTVDDTTVIYPEPAWYETFATIDSSQGPSETLEWLGNIATVDSSDVDIQDIPQYGAYFFRKEMFVMEHTGGFIRFREAPLEYIETEPPDEFDSTYYVNWFEDQSDRVIQIRSTDYDPRNQNIKTYIPVLEKLATFGKCQGIELKNLEFRYANSYWRDAAISFQKVGRVVIDNCIFRDNNGKGLAIGGCPAAQDSAGNWTLQHDLPLDQVFVRDCQFIDNGIYGCSVGHSSGLTFDNCSFKGNNWLGYHSGTMGWATGASKFFKVHRVILNHIESEDNFGTGIWFDQDGRAISILNSNLSNNYFRGLFLEAGPGSFYVDSCSFVDNSKDLPADVEIIEFEYQLGEEIRTGLNLNSVGSSSFSHCEFDQTGTGSDVTPIRIARSYGRTVMAPLIPPPERPYVLSTFLSIFNDCIFRRPSMGGSEPIWIGYPNDDQFCHFMNRTNLLISYNGNTWYTGQTEDPNPPTDLMDGVECEWDPLPYIIVPAQKQD